MNCRNAMPFVLALASHAAAAYLASCRCGDPGSPGRGGRSATEGAEDRAESARATSDPTLAQSRHALDARLHGVV